MLEIRFQIREWLERLGMDLGFAVNGGETVQDLTGQIRKFGGEKSLSTRLFN